MSTDWLKTGAAAVAAMGKEKAKAAARSAGGRWYLKPGTSGMLTFLDGVVTEDGIFAAPHYYEHEIKVDGRKMPDFYVCLNSEEGDQQCPICNENRNPTFVGALTVIDHTPWKDRDDKVHKNNRRLFIYKRDSQSTLLELAKLRGGSLAGCTFAVIRPEGQRTARIGTLFEYKGKSDLAAIQQKFGKEGAVYDYRKALPYLSQEDLKKLGFGNRDVIGGEATSAAPSGSGEFTPDQVRSGEPDFDLSTLD